MDIRLTNDTGALSDEGKALVYYLRSRGLPRMISVIEELYPDEHEIVYECPEHLRVPAAAWIIERYIIDNHWGDTPANAADLVRDHELPAYRVTLAHLRDTSWSSWMVLERDMRTVERFLT